MKIKELEAVVAEQAQQLAAMQAEINGLKIALARSHGDTRRWQRRAYDNRPLPGVDPLRHAALEAAREEARRTGKSVVVKLSSQNID